MEGRGLRSEGKQSEGYFQHHLQVLGKREIPVFWKGGRAARTSWQADIRLCSPIGRVPGREPALRRLCFPAGFPGDGLDVFEKSIGASGEGKLSRKKRGTPPRFSLPQNCQRARASFFLQNLLWLSNPCSQFLQARNFKVEMLRGILFDAGIVSPVPKNGGTRYSLLCTSDFRKGRGSSCR